MKKQILTQLFLLFISSFAYSQQLDTTKLNAYFDALEQNDKFMGSVAVAQNGKIIYKKSVGYIDVEKQLKADENSKYRIGSISKTFTAVMVMKAIEQKKIDLNQSIENFFPTIPNAKEITIRNLLNHRSGIHNFTNDEAFMSWLTETKTAKEMIEIITKGGSDFAPDSKSEYSNSNFVLLSFILENVFNKPYAALVKSYFTTPLKLSKTFYGGKINTANNECLSYTFTDKWNLETETNLSIPLGAGGIVSTPSDLVKFAYALFEDNLLTSESLDTMKKAVGRFGAGLFQMPFGDNIGYGHSGAIDGFSSSFTHYPDGISYAIISNGSDFNNNEISIAVLSAVYNKAFDVPSFKKYEISSKELDAYLGVYSSPDFPLKITMTKENTTLIAQATGQGPLPLAATEKNVFTFDKAGIVLVFDPSKNTVLLKQGGGEVLMTKE